MAAAELKSVIITFPQAQPSDELKSVIQTYIDGYNAKKAHHKCVDHMSPADESVCTLCNQGPSLSIEFATGNLRLYEWTCKFHNIAIKLLQTQTTKETKDPKAISAARQTVMECKAEVDAVRANICWVRYFHGNAFSGDIELKARLKRDDLTAALRSLNQEVFSGWRLNTTADWDDAIDDRSVCDVMFVKVA
jgi:hypothetical protein